MIQRFKQAYDRSLHQYVMVADDEGDYYFADDVDRELAAASTDKHDEMMSLRERVGELEKSLQSMKNFAAEVYALIDADKEVKAMKLAGAMAGNKGYRHDVDAALAPLIAEAVKERGND